MIPTCELSSREHHFDAVRYKVGWMSIVVTILWPTPLSSRCIMPGTTVLSGISVPMWMNTRPLQVPASIRLTLNNTGVSLAQFRFIPKVETGQAHEARISAPTPLSNQVAEFPVDRTPNPRITNPFPPATQHEEPEFCKHWLSVSPVWGLLTPGESIDICLTTYVDERSVRTLTHLVVVT